MLLRTYFRFYAQGSAKEFESEQKGWKCYASTDKYPVQF